MTELNNNNDTIFMENVERGIKEKVRDNFYSGLERIFGSGKNPQD